MGEKTFSKRIAKTKLDEARDKLSRARSEDMKKYWKGIIDIRLDEYNSLNKGGMPKKKLAKGGAMVAKKKMRGGGMAKMASKPFTRIGNWFWKKHRDVLDWNDK
jgi:hypothetical protein